jgi:uncharacterized membrane protein YgdD (TMEM256/DUF423 family)|tara:strand:- start:245 stop:616 length:372 start_codon:yes stop_codon:yes gene_type:complete
MRGWIITGAVMAGIAILLGSFGAHGLKNKITADYLAIFNTGVKYHFYHALGLIIIGILAFHFPSEPLNLPSIFFVAGICLFSGSLYVLSITGLKWVGAITPLGGLSFIIGWILTAYYIWRASP